MGDEGLERIGRVLPLRRLRIATSRGTAAGFRHLRHLTNLRELELSYCEVDGDWFSPVSEMKDLTVLRLVRCRLPDEGLERLGQLDNLRELNLRASGISSREIQNLRRSLPACAVAN